MASTSKPALPEINTEPSPRKLQYCIAFPPGPMGLELEPVITSSERQIGCRVKDYYFGIDHHGIDPSFVRENITVGDIIVKINGDSVMSSKFLDILERLKSTRETTRTIEFKNISIPYDSSKSPSSPSFWEAMTSARVATPAAIITSIKSNEKDLKLNNHNKLIESSENKENSIHSNTNLSDKKHFQHVHYDLPPLLPPVTRHTSHHSNSGYESDTSSLHESIAPSSSKSKLMMSPQAVRNLTRSPSLKSMTYPPLFSSAVTSGTGSNTTSPPAIDTILTSDKSSSSSTAVTDNQLNTNLELVMKRNESLRRMGLLPTLLNNNQVLTPEMQRLLQVMADSVGHSLVQVGQQVTHQAVDVVSAVGTTVGDHTEKLLFKAIDVLPKYNEHEFRDIILKKDALLNELSRTCYLLGVTEDMKQSLEEEMKTLRHKEIQLSQENYALIEDLHLLQQEFDQVRCERDELIRLQCTQDRNTQTEKKKEMIFNQVIEDQKIKISSLQETVATITSDYEHLQTAYTQLQTQYTDDEKKWKFEYDNAIKVQNDTFNDMKVTFEQAMSQIQNMEQHRDSLLKELEELRQVHIQDTQKYDIENKNYQKKMMEIQTSHEEEIDIKMKKIQEYKVIISQYEQSMDELTTANKREVEKYTQERNQYYSELKECQQVYTTLQSSYTSLQATYSSLQQEKATLEQQLQVRMKNMSQQEHDTDTRIQQLQLDIQQVSNTNHTLQEEYKTLTSQYATLEIQHDTLIQDHQHQVKENQEVVETYKDLSTKYTVLTQEYDQKLSDNTQLISTITTLKESFHRQENEFLTLKNNAEQAQRILQEELVHMNQSYESSHSEKEKLLKEKMEDMTQKIMVLEAELLLLKQSHQQQVTQLVSDHDMTIQVMKSNHSKSIEELNGKIKEKQAEINLFLEFKSTWKEEQDLFNDQQKYYEEKIDKLISALETEQQNNHLQEQSYHTQLTQLRHTYHTNLQSCQFIIKRLQSELSHLKQDMTSYQHVIDAMTSKLLEATQTHRQNISKTPTTIITTTESTSAAAVVAAAISQQEYQQLVEEKDNLNKKYIKSEKNYKYLEERYDALLKESLKVEEEFSEEIKQYSGKFKESEAKFKELEIEYEAIQKQLSFYKEKNAVLSRQVNTMESDYDKVLKDATSNKTEIQLYQEKLHELMKQKNELENNYLQQVEVLKSEITYLHSVQKQTDASKEKEMNRWKEVQLQNQQLLSSKKIVADKITTLEIQLSHWKEKYHEVEMTFNDKMQQWEVLKNELIQSYESKYNELRTLSEQKYKTLVVEKDELSKRYDLQIKEYTVLKESYEHQKVEYQKMTYIVDDIKIEYDEKRKELQSTIQDIKNQLMEKQTEFDRLKITADTKFQQLITDHTHQIQQLTTALSIEKSKYDNLVQEKQKLEVILSESNVLIQDKSTRIHQLNLQVTQSEYQLKMIKQEFMEHQQLSSTKIEQLQSEIQISEKKLVQLQQQYSQYSSNATTSNSEIQLLKNDKEKYIRQIQEMLHVIETQNNAIIQAEFNEKLHIENKEKYEMMIREKEMIYQQTIEKMMKSEKLAVEKIHELERQIYETQDLLLIHKNESVMIELDKRQDIDILKKKLQESEKALQLTTETLHALQNNQEEKVTDRLILKSENIRYKDCIMEWHRVLINHLISLHEALTTALFEYSEFMIQPPSINTASSSSSKDHLDDSPMTTSTSSTLSVSKVLEILTQQRWDNVSRSLHAVHTHALSIHTWLRQIDSNSSSSVSKPYTPMSGNDSIFSTFTDKEIQSTASAYDTIHQYYQFMDKNLCQNHSTSHLMSPNISVYPSYTYVAIIKMLVRIWKKYKLVFNEQKIIVPSYEVQKRLIIPQSTHTSPTSVDISPLLTRTPLTKRQRQHKPRLSTDSQPSINSDIDRHFTPTSYISTPDSKYSLTPMSPFSHLQGNTVSQDFNKTTSSHFTLSPETPMAADYDSTMMMMTSSLQTSTKEDIRGSISYISDDESCVSVESMTAATSANYWNFNESNSSSRPIIDRQQSLEALEM